jgi:hypothetical protein
MILIFQVIWALLCVGWNAYGLYLLSRGEHPLGPAASATVAIVFAVFAFLFWYFKNRQMRWPYLLLSAVSLLLAAYAVYGGFVQDHSLWPSEGWRWAGIVINGVGGVANAMAVIKAVSKN